MLKFADINRVVNSSNSAVFPIKATEKIVRHHKVTPIPYFKNKLPCLKVYKSCLVSPSKLSLLKQ